MYETAPQRLTYYGDAPLILTVLNRDYILGGGGGTIIPIKDCKNKGGNIPKHILLDLGYKNPTEENETILSCKDMHGLISFVYIEV